MSLPSWSFSAFASSPASGGDHQTHLLNNTVSLLTISRVFCFSKRILIVLTYYSLLQKRKHYTTLVRVTADKIFFFALVSMVRGQSVLVPRQWPLPALKKKKGEKKGSTRCPRRVQTPAQASPSANCTSPSISCLHLRFSATWE